MRVLIRTVANTPAGIYLLKVNNRNTRTSYEICSKLCQNDANGFEHVIAAWVTALSISERFTH